MKSILYLGIFIGWIFITCPANGQTVTSESSYTDYETDLHLEELKTIFYSHSIWIECQVAVREGYKMIVLERSLNGVDFEGVRYFRIQQNSMNQLVSYADAISSVTQTVFYRIRQADNELHSLTSQPVKVSRQVHAPCQILGNPFSSAIQVACNLSTKEQPVTIRVNQLDGSLVSTQTRYMQGQQIVTIDQPENLAAGFYLVEVSVGNDLYNFKLLKQ